MREWEEQSTQRPKVRVALQRCEGEREREGACNSRTIQGSICECVNACWFGRLRGAEKDKVCQRGWDGVGVCTYVGRGKEEVCG